MLNWYIGTPPGMRVTFVKKGDLKTNVRGEKDALERGLVRAPWSINSDVQEWITPGMLQDYYANCGLSPNGNDYDDSGFATYP